MEHLDICLVNKLSFAMIERILIFHLNFSVAFYIWPRLFIISVYPVAVQFVGCLFISGWSMEKRIKYVYQGKVKYVFKFIFSLNTSYQEKSIDTRFCWGGILNVNHNRDLYRKQIITRLSFPSTPAECWRFYEGHILRHL